MERETLKETLKNLSESVKEFFKQEPGQPIKRAIGCFKRGVYVVSDKAKPKLDACVKRIKDSKLINGAKSSFEKVRSNEKYQKFLKKLEEWKDIIDKKIENIKKARAEDSLFILTRDMLATLNEKDEEFKEKWENLTAFQKTYALALCKWDKKKKFSEAINDTEKVYDNDTNYNEAYGNVGSSFERGLESLMDSLEIEEEEKKEHLKSFLGLGREREEQELDPEIKKLIKLKINNRNKYGIVFKALSNIHHGWIFDSTKSSEKSKIGRNDRFDTIYQFGLFEFLCKDEAYNDMNFIESNLIFIQSILKDFGIEFSDKAFSRYLHRQKVLFLKKHNISDMESLKNYLKSEEMKKYLTKDGNEARLSSNAIAVSKDDTILEPKKDGYTIYEALTMDNVKFKFEEKDPMSFLDVSAEQIMDQIGEKALQDAFPLKKVVKKLSGKFEDFSKKFEGFSKKFKGKDEM